MTAGFARKRHGNAVRYMIQVGCFVCSVAEMDPLTSTGFSVTARTLYEITLTMPCQAHNPTYRTTSVTSTKLPKAQQILFEMKT